MAGHESAGTSGDDGDSGREGTTTQPDNPWAAPPPGAPPFDRTSLPAPPSYAGTPQGPPPVYGSPPGPPPRLETPLTPKPQRSQRGVVAIWAGASSILSLLLFPSPLGILLGVAAVVLGISARRRSRATGVPAPGAVTAIVIGVLGVVLTAVPLALVYPASSDHRHCVSRANTDIAREICDKAYQDSLRNSFGY